MNRSETLQLCVAGRQSLKALSNTKWLSLRESWQRLRILNALSPFRSFQQQAVSTVRKVKRNLINIHIFGGRRNENS